MAKKKRRRKNSLYPEPGAWVKELEDYEPSELPQNRKLTTAEVRDFIGYEGLGFCVRDYILQEKIADKRLAELWEQARKALQRIIERIEVVTVSRKRGP